MSIYVLRYISTKIKISTINKKGGFVLLIFTHRRKKFCKIGAYSNIKSIHQKSVLEILRKKEVFLYVLRYIYL